MTYYDSLILHIRDLLIPGVVSDLLNGESFLCVCVQDVSKNVGSVFTHKFRDLIVGT